MYLYSSDTNSMKIMLSKSDAEHFILNQPSRALRKSMIFAIFKVALPKSKLSLCRGNIYARLFEYTKGRFILEFRQEKPIQQLYCYSCSNLNEVAQTLRNLIEKKAETSKLYCKGNRYFLLSEKRAHTEIYNKSEYIDSVLEEYAHLISKNAAKEIEGLL